MLKSGQIKSEINRLTSELGEKERFLAEHKAQALARCQKTETVLLDFFRQRRAEIERAQRERTQEAEDGFSKKLAELKKTIEATNADFTYAAWDDPVWRTFEIQKRHPAHDKTRLGTFEIEGKNASLVMPAVFSILGGKNIFLRAKGSGRQKARQTLRNVALRLLASLPPGKLRFIFIDPRELGSTAAGLVGAFPDLTGGAAWHEEQDIQEQLSRIQSRIADVKTKKLGAEFSSIEEYNAQPGTIEEPYWLAVIADCPVHFRKDALQRLVNIAKNGPPTGVYLAVMLDDAHVDCDDALVTDLAETAHHIVYPDHDDSVFFDDLDFRKVDLCLDLSPPVHVINRITEQVSKAAATAQNVRIEWEALPMDKWWTEDSGGGLKIPLGSFGARKVQLFEINEELLNSALIIGRSGSGKSKLLHALIAGMVTRYSPREVRLYLLDCKQVEFKDYATHWLPHARVVATESDREFGLSVLRDLNITFQDRKNKYSALGETKFSSYRDKTNKNEPEPRIILIIDEFQELLQDDALGHEAAGILDGFIRQGRAFGINVILATQTLSGQTALRSSTRNQIPIRIVLQCSQSDSRLALSEENDEAHLLERPGEAIYNAANGRPEKQQRFQVSWLSDERLESLLNEISTKAAKHELFPAEPLVVFNGNSFADIRQNGTLKGFLKKTDAVMKRGGTFAWLGEPIEMKKPTAVIFRRQSRSNLLIIGQRDYEELCSSMLLASIVSIGTQQPADDAEFIVYNPGDPPAARIQLLEAIQRNFPHKCELVTKSKIGETLKHLASAIDERPTQTSSTKSIYFLIFGLHLERDFRRPDINPFSKSNTPPSDAQLLSKICRDGPPMGIHSLIWCDTFSNFSRVFQLRPQNDLEEFSARVAMLMSDKDSRSLLDTDAAAHLGSYRAMFFDDEKGGYLEKFRPYSTVSADWISEVGRQIIK